MYYGKDHKVKSIIPRKRITVRAGEISKGVTCKNRIVDYLKTRLEYIDGAIGCITLQLFYSSCCKRIIGIEINPRFGGGFPLSYIAGGNYPDWLIKEYLFGENIDYFDNWEDNLLMLRYDDEVIIHGYQN
jgi:carbamoyl-phosphate synthase large subunit